MAVEVAYVDFSKAFDTVSHSLLLEKWLFMACIGVLVKTWLSGQAQRVAVNGVTSSW